VHITVYCPACRNHYHVEPELRGLHMRCLNPACREIFVVEGAQPESPATVKTGDSSGPDVIGLVPLEEESNQPGSGAPPVDEPKNGGAVGDMIPILDAELVEEAPAPGSAKKSRSARSKEPLPTAQIVEEPQGVITPTSASWRDAPPVRKPSARGLSTQIPLVQLPASPPAEPTEEELPVQENRSIADRPPTESETAQALPIPAWNSPPRVRRWDTEEKPQSEFSEPTHSPQATDPTVSPPEQPEDGNEALVRAPRKKVLWVISAMAVAAGILVVTVIVVAMNRYWDTENRIFKEAQLEYEDGKFGAASRDFEKLDKEFPESSNRPRYRFYAALSHIHDQVQNVSADPRDELAHIKAFIEEYKTDPLLKERGTEVGNDLLKIAEALIDLAESRNDASILVVAREVYDGSIRFKASAHGEDIIQRFANAEQKIQREQERQRLIATLQDLLHKDPSLEMVEQARFLVRRAKFENEPEVRDLLTKLDGIVTSKIRYVVDNIPPQSLSSPRLEPSLLLASPLVLPEKLPQGNSPVVLALARGVVYAFDQGNSRPLWAMRVGVDTTALPIRLEREFAAVDDLFLILSADREEVMALAAKDGHVQWRQRLDAPSLGSPLVVDRKAYIPTYKGRIYEIETVGGTLLGHFELNQPLNVGGVCQKLENTNLLYFPGDSDNVYILEVPTRQGKGRPEPRCTMILHTGHPAGSLRSEPIIINRIDPNAIGGGGQAEFPSYLILSQSDGLSDMKLRAYSLPIQNPDAAPLPLEARVKGWSWFKPYYDYEKLAFVTDKGYLGLFGINQIRNDDPALFRMFGAETRLGAGATGLSRGQVVHAAENDFWILVNGELQRFRLYLYGEKMIPLWTAWLAKKEDNTSKRENALLGTPLHAGQFDEKRRVLFVVTQDLHRQVHLATAVNGDTGQILWQRQLGMDCQNDPIVLGREVVVADRGGGLFAFDADKGLTTLSRRWKLAAAMVSGPLVGKGVTSYLFPSPDGASVYQLACPSQETSIWIREYQAGKDGPKIATERSVPINVSSLAGTPDRSSGGFLLPLAEGTIKCIMITPNGIIIKEGPNWHSGHADKGVQGHIVRINDEEFIVTDGRKLTHWKWPANGEFATVPPNQMPTVELPARIVGPPVVLPATAPGAELQVCVADSEGTISLLQGPGLKRVRFWQVNGKISAGLFLRGPYLGCVVSTPKSDVDDRKHLVWIDPTKETEPHPEQNPQKPLWPEFTTPGDGIVGEPQIVQGMVVVVDKSGRFVGLDPATGHPLGRGYFLDAKAAPAATAVAYGADEAFVPLSDGTVFILPLSQLRSKP